MSSSQQLPRRSSSSLAALVLLVLVAVLAIYATSVQADGDGMAGGEGGEMSAMADAIKYLQGLDKVYGQAARPRSNSLIKELPRSSRSSADDGSGLGSQIARILQLIQLDRRYDNTLVRPRFGKRGGRYPYFDLDDMQAAVGRPQRAY